MRKDYVLTQNNETAIFGPPGTGKTTKLLQIIEDAIADGIQPERIAFLSFTQTFLLFRIIYTFSFYFQ